MAMLIGGPEEKYAQMGLLYPEMKKMVRVEDDLRAVAATAATGLEQSIHRQVQLITDGLAKISDATGSAADLAGGPARGVPEYSAGATARGLHSLYGDIDSALRSVETAVLALEDNLDAVAGGASRHTVRDPIAARQAVFEFRRDLLSLAANRLDSSRSSAFASNQPDTARLEEDNRFIREVLASWTKTAAGI